MLKKINLKQVFLLITLLVVLIGLIDFTYYLEYVDLIHLDKRVLSLGVQDNRGIYKIKVGETFKLVLDSNWKNIRTTDAILVYNSKGPNYVNNNFLLSFLTPNDDKIPDSNGEYITIFSGAFAGKAKIVAQNIGYNGQCKILKANIPDTSDKNGCYSIIINVQH